ncbi:MAG: DUF177 domain-containing protein [Elusimicrobia bacterium]|nr:DUF177 domain-containing protein [Elusimicrobiota bacterium]
MSSSLIFSSHEIQDQNGLAGSFELDPAVFQEAFSEAKLSIPITVGLEFSVGGNRILLQAHVQGEWELSCSRCLTLFRAPFGNEVEETYPLTQAQIDVGDEVRQSLILSVPSKPLCRESCLGLCPRCGQNLNDKLCQCKLSH